MLTKHRAGRALVPTVKIELKRLKYYKMTKKQEASENCNIYLIVEESLISLFEIYSYKYVSI